MLWIQECPALWLGKCPRAAGFPVALTRCKHILLQKLNNKLAILSNNSTVTNNILGDIHRWKDTCILYSVQIAISSHSLLPVRLKLLAIKNITLKPFIK